MATGFDAKLSRVRAFLSERNFAAVVLTRLENLFWLGCGLDAHVPVAAETAVATLVVTPHRAALITSNIEAPRLLDEELGSANLELLVAPWHEDGQAGLVAEVLDGATAVAADMAAPGRTLVNLAPLRYSLLPTEVTAYRAHGASQGEVIGEVAATFEPGATEFEVAGQLAAALLARGITPTVLLVAADERIAHYRHPIPTHRRIERAALLVCGGRRAGLVVSVSRMICFGEPGADLRRRHRAVCDVDAAFIAHTTPGARVADVFAAGQAAYAAAGFADEWRHHHQGGATGYAGRDYRGTPDSQEIVQAWQAFAWNPSIAGTKSEDTIIATPDGPEVLSGTPDWPLLECRAEGRGIARADLLVR